MKTVLIVDDNRDAADTLAMLIKLKGHKALVAYDAVAGLEVARATLPDLIFHDIRSPKMGGYFAIRELRANSKLTATICVALTGFATTSDHNLALSAGFNYHVAKPMDFKLLDRLLA